MEESLWNTECNPVEDIKIMVEKIKNATGIAPNHIIIGSKSAVKIDYIVNTKIIKQWPGYERKLGPDGKTWISDRHGKNWRNNIRFGTGNKAKRKAALILYCKTLTQDELLNLGGY